MRISSLILVASLLAGGANAQSITSSDPESLLRELRSMGYDVRLEPYDSGRPRIRTSSLGINYSIAFYGCLNDMTDCRGMMLTSGFDMDDGTNWEIIDGWNETRVYTRAFLDDENDPYVQMPVPVARDFNHDDVARIMDIWEDAIVDFTDEIGFERRDASAPSTSDPVASGSSTSSAPAATGRVGPKKAPSNSSLGSK